MNEKDHVVLAHLSASPEWNVVRQLSIVLMNKIRSEPKIKDTDYETLREVFMQEGRVEGIRRLLDAVEENTK